MIKTCKKCKTSYEASNIEEMREFFHYKKTKSGNYLLNTCKVCQREINRGKYHEGTYNYTQSDNDNPSPEEEK